MSEAFILDKDPQSSLPAAELSDAEVVVGADGGDGIIVSTERLDSVLDDVLQRIMPGKGHAYLKSFQRYTIESLLTRQVVAVGARCGAGKSLVTFLFTLVMEVLQPDTHKHLCGIIIMPAISL